MFDLSGEFDKVYSTDASDFLGGIDRAKRAEEQRFAGDALTNIARLKMAKKGLTMAPGPQGYASGGSGLGDQIIGALGRGLSSGLNNLFGEMSWNNQRYGSPSITPYRGELPSTTTDWAPPPPPPPVPGS